MVGIEVRSLKQRTELHGAWIGRESHYVHERTTSSTLAHSVSVSRKTAVNKIKDMVVGMPWQYHGEGGREVDGSCDRNRDVGAEERD